VPVRLGLSPRSPFWQDTSFNTVKVFIFKPYGSVFSDADIVDINTEKVSLHLVYKGICDKTILHILAIEK
jgi:hypothetical protein